MRVFYGDVFLNRECLLREGIEHPIKLEYYKTINEKIFGIYIIKIEYKKNEIITEEKEIKKLSYSEGTVEKILSLLKKHAVTPITAEYVVEDLQKEKVF